MNGRVIVKWSKKAKFQYNDKLLREVFGRYGEIVDLTIKPKKSTCYIEFSDKNAAIAACGEEGNSHTGLEVKMMN